MTTIQVIGIFFVGGGMCVMWTTFMSDRVRSRRVTIFVIGGLVSLIAYAMGRGLL